MKDVAKGMHRVLPHLDAILSSPLKRARHTAEIVVDALPFQGTIELCDQLLPGTPVGEVYSLLSGFRSNQNIMLVGHEPGLGLLVSSLLGAKGSVLEFKKGGLCALDVEKIPPAHPAILLWHLTPRQLRLMGRT